MLSRQESVALDEKDKNYAWIHVHICRLPGDGRTSHPNNGSDDSSTVQVHFREFQSLKTSFFIKGMKYKRIRSPECHSTHSLYHFRCNEHSAVDHKGIAKGIRYCQLVIASNARAPFFSFPTGNVR